MLVMVGLQSCRTYAISATALDLNNYQTGKTLTQGESAISTQIAYAPSVIGYVSGKGEITFLPMAAVAVTSAEFGVLDDINIGLAGQISSTRLFLDMDAGLRGYIKKGLTDTLSPFAASVLIGTSIQWGTTARTKDVGNSQCWGCPPPNPFYLSRDTIITMTDSKISSQVNRVHIALPTSWRIWADSSAQPYFSPTKNWTDICVTPALHLVHQNIYLQDSSYKMIWRNRAAITTPTEFVGTRHIVTPYIIPSLSIGACFRVSVAEIFPEATIARANNAITFGAGISIRGLFSKL